MRRPDTAAAASAELPAPRFLWSAPAHDVWRQINNETFISQSQTKSKKGLQMNSNSKLEKIIIDNVSLTTLIYLLMRMRKTF